MFADLANGLLKIVVLTDVPVAFVSMVAFLSIRIGVTSRLIRNKIKHLLAPFRNGSWEWISNWSTIIVERENGRREIISAPLGASDSDISKILSDYLKREQQIIKQISEELSEEVKPSGQSGPDIIISRGNMKIGVEVVFGIEHGLAKMASKLMTNEVDELVIVNVGSGHVSPGDSKVIRHRSNIEMIDGSPDEDIVARLKEAIEKKFSLE